MRSWRCRLTVHFSSPGATFAALVLLASPPFPRHCAEASNAPSWDPPLRSDHESLPAGDRRALDHLFSVTYEELRRLAASVKRSDPNASLTPTTLVNEAWLKLAGSPELAATSPLHFKRIAARAMRQVLIEAARRRNAEKRGGKDAVFVTFDDSLETPISSDEELLVLDSALEGLAKLNPRQALMVEGRFFGGLDVAETAQLLEVSEATVLRDWRAARAWLAVQLRGAR
jgi:RNA polymerase sigma factor (TIGR02999 family)